MGCDVCISHEQVPGALNQQKPLKTVAAMMVLQLNLILSQTEVESPDWKESSKPREASQDEKFLFMKKNEKQINSGNLMSIKTMSPRFQERSEPKRIAPKINVRFHHY